MKSLKIGFSSNGPLAEDPDLSVLGKVLELYFGGDMEASIALSGQVAGRIESVRPVAEILHEMVHEFREVARGLSDYAAD